MLIREDLRPCFEAAYVLYSMHYDSWNKLTKSGKSHARRQVETTVREAGFNGVTTGLISVAAWKSVIDEKNGIELTKHTRVAKEHPVTHKNIALYCLTTSTKLNFDDYFKVWFDNLVITYTTNEENQRLRKHQSNYRFGVDCWKKMYEDAGIELMVRPKLNTKAAKIAHGVKV